MFFVIFQVGFFFHFINFNDIDSVVFKIVIIQYF